MDQRTPGIRLRPTLGRRLDAMARRGFPTACAMLLMLLAAAPLGLPDQAALLPALALVCVYFWSLFRPASMTPPMVFAIGLLLDLLGYTPLGLGVLMLLSVHGITVQSRRFLLRHGFAFIWIMLALLANLVFVAGWALSSLLALRPLPFGPALFQAALAIALYPALGSLLARAHTTIADPDHA